MDRLVNPLFFGLRLEPLMEGGTGVRATVIGNFALDVYWNLEATRAVRPLENGRHTWPVRRIQCSPGGGAAFPAFGLSPAAGASPTEAAPLVNGACAVERRKGEGTGMVIPSEFLSPARRTQNNVGIER